MVTIAQLRDWAKVSTAEYDDTLRLIEAGILELLSKSTNRTLVSPVEMRSAIVTAPELQRHGLTGVMAATQQRIRLIDEVQQYLSGTVAGTADSTTITGTDTRFTEQLVAGSRFLADAGGWHVVASITSDTELELEGAVEADFDGVAALVPGGVVSIEKRSGAGTEFELLDLADFEMTAEGEIYAVATDLPTTYRGVRVKYLVGYDEGQGPAGIVLLVLQMVKAFWQEKKRSSSSIAIDGAFTVQWADFGGSAQTFMERAKSLRRPVGFA